MCTSIREEPTRIVDVISSAGTQAAGTKSKKKNTGIALRKLPRETRRIADGSKRVRIITYFRRDGGKFRWEQIELSAKTIW
jgi:hypothetical protein